MQEGVELPYSFDRVWNTAIMVLDEAQWKVTRADKATGGIEIHTNMDLLTWTEIFYVNLIRIGANSTRVIMGRIGVAQPLDWGMARQFIEQFLLKLEPALKNAETAASTSPG